MSSVSAPRLASSPPCAAVLALSCAALSGIVSCSAAQTPESSPAAETSSAETNLESDLGASSTDGSPPPSDGAADAEAEAMALIEAEQAAIAEEEAEQTEADATETPREVVYRMTQQGLIVEIEGTEFRPRVEAKPRGPGWGLELSVTAEATESRQLLASNQGPLAFGGKIERKTGKQERFGDRRDGERLVELEPGTPKTFTRQWPDSASDALRPGDELELQVGLWGYGQGDDDRKPVRKFVAVRMKAGKAGAQPIVEPPRQ